MSAQDQINEAIDAFLGTSGIRVGSIQMDCTIRTCDCCLGDTDETFVVTGSTGCIVGEVCKYCADAIRIVNH